MDALFRNSCQSRYHHRNEHYEMGRQSNHVVLYVVEDDEDDKIILSSELLAHGQEFEVHFFPDVYNLIAFINTHPLTLPSLVLIPAFIKSIDVRQAVAFLKSVPELSSVSIVLMLGSQGEKDYSRLLNLDVSGFVIKPVSSQELSGSLAKSRGLLNAI